MIMAAKYRLDVSMNNHRPEKIQALLAQARLPVDVAVDWFEQLDSTSNFLLCREHVHGRVCITELQTGGRGRRGRQWLAPPSSSVLMSLGWHLGGASPAGLSLLAGIAVVDAMSELGIEGVALKWPNDLQAGGKKLGGILVELSADRCVLGMGINVNIPGSAGMNISQPWTDLVALGYRVDRDQLAARLIISSFCYLNEFNQSGFSPFVERWNRLHALHGVEVSVSAGQEVLSGVVAGVSDSGELLLNREGKLHAVASGEVSVRARTGPR